MRTWNKWRHVGRELPAFHDGALPADRMRRISEHLGSCGRCRREYDDTRFVTSVACQLTIEEAPHGLWKSIDARWEEERMACQSAPAGWPLRIKSWLFSAWPPPGRNFGPGVAAAGAICLLILAALLAWRPGRWSVQSRSNFPARALAGKSLISDANNSSTPEPSWSGSARFDLAAYIGPVKASANDRCVRAISNAAPLFVVAGKEEAFRAAGLGGSLGEEEPLPGYRLVAYRVCAAGADRLAQLVYSHGDDAFCVFVAPRRIELLVGRDAVVDTNVRGIRCRKVDCPQQCTYLFGAGRFHCVLVSKSINDHQAAAVMRYFMSAHKQRRQG